MGGEGVERRWEWAGGREEEDRGRYGSWRRTRGTERSMEVGTGKEWEGGEDEEDRGRRSWRLGVGRW
jgi:hypothetical protein